MRNKRGFVGALYTGDKAGRNVLQSTKCVRIFIQKPNSGVKPLFHQATETLAMEYIKICS